MKALLSTRRFQVLIDQMGDSRAEHEVNVPSVGGCREEGIVFGLVAYAALEVFEHELRRFLRILATSIK